MSVAMNEYLTRFGALLAEHCEDRGNLGGRLPHGALVLKGAPDENLVYADVVWEMREPQDDYEGEQPTGDVMRLEACVSGEVSGVAYAMRGWALIDGEWHVDYIGALDPIETLEAEIERMAVPA